MKSLAHPISRRDFVKRSSAGMAAAALPGMLRNDFKNIPVGVQLYPVRHELAKEMEPVLGTLARMGYQGVEFADYFGRTARQLRAMLDDAGLKAIGTHIMMDTLVGDELQKTIEFNQTLGNKYLVVRWLNDPQRDSLDALHRTIDQFNEISESLKPHGMRLGYHNHDYIFDTFNGEMMWNIIADRVHPDFFLQLDTGNAMIMPGVDPVELLRRNPGRTVTMHVKPYSRQNPNAFIGEDDLDWETIFRLSENGGGVEWYIIEYEQPAFPPLEALEANLNNFRRMRA